MNKRRKAIWDKSGGKCWYCGVNLPEKGWHEDHAEPILRNCGKGGGHLYPHLDNEDNKVPACAPCNLFKAGCSVEGFRNEVSKQVERARKSSVNFRVAERFGLIEEKAEEVVFWFEVNK